MNRRITSTAMLTALALVLTACPSKSVGDSGAGAPTQAAAPTTAPTTAPTAAPTTAPTAAPTANPDQALIDLLKGGKASAYKVTYAFTMSGGTSSSQTGTLTQTVKAPQFRQDMTVTAGGDTLTISTFITAQGTFTCGAFVSATPACFNFAGASGAAIAPQAPTSVPTDLTGWNLVPTTSKNVAGQDTRCFTFTGPASTSGPTAGQTVTSTGCYTSQGVPLYISSKVGTVTSEMTATSFSTTVSDADFVLPYPVQKLPGQP